MKKTILVLLFIIGCVPNLTVHRVPLPKIESSESRKQLLSYNNFLLLPTSKGEELNEIMNITPTARHEVYKYEFSKIGQLNNAIKKVLRESNPDINIIEKDVLPIILEEQSLNMSGLTDKDFEKFSELKSVDAIILIKADYLRNKLKFVIDPLRGYMAVWFPELSVSIRVVSIKSRELISSKSITLSSQMFFKEEKRIYKIGKDFRFLSIDALIDIAPYYLLQDFMDDETAWFNYYTKIKSIPTNNKRIIHSDLKKYLLINPESPKILSSIGWIYAELGDIKAFERYSIDAYDLIKDKKNKPYWIIFNYGSAMLSKGEIDDAERVYREAIKLSGDPSIIDTLNKDLEVLEKISPELQKSVAEIRKRLF